MTELFIRILNMSISASWVLLAVVVVRLFLKKAPKWAMVLLWGIVAVRLICPISIESALSLVPSAQTISTDILLDITPTLDTGISAVNEVVNPILSGSNMPAVGASVNPLQVTFWIGTVVWIFGMAVMGAYAGISYMILRRSVRTAVRLEGNVYQCECVSSPFVLGIFRPRIYLPFALHEGSTSHVVTHERAHIRRKDHLWKPIGYMLLSIHWFNPLMWLGYILLCRDIELACDEKVIKELGKEERAGYSAALLSCCVKRRIISACPVAFGEVGVKTRIKTVLSYKKPAFWVVVLAVAACIVVAACFLTNPMKGNDDTQEDKYYLLIGAEDVLDIEVSMPNSCNGVRHADNSTFKKGEKVYLEQLNVDSDLRGIVITALDKDGNIVYAFSIPEKASDDEIAKLVGADSWLVAPTQTTVMLSLDDVIILSKKGYDLTWSDFEQYDYTESGFGLYIRVYKINDLFELRIGGAGLDSDPMYIYLTLADAYDIKIDIRDGGVEEFISAHNVPPTDNGAVIPMVMIDGTLYLDTKCESTIDGRCGVMDGEITSHVHGTEKPTIDNQSNFGTGYGYQYGATEGTIEIYMDGKWWIFATEEVRQLIQFPLSTDNEKEDHRIEGEIEAGSAETLNPNDTTIWHDGVSFDALEPNEETVSSFEISLNKESNSVSYNITWTRTGLTLEYGLRSSDGTEYYNAHAGGCGNGQFQNIPAGSYRLFVRNTDYSGVPAYENPEVFSFISFNATGAMNYRIE